MLNYNSDNILVGYIKQLLHTFNLPTIRVYTEGTYAYKDCYYIYKNNIVECTQTTSNLNSNNFKVIYSYTKNKKITNFTDNLRIENIIYDSHTHNYLGDYLRFIRDYDNINLMPLYNCFSNELVQKLSISTTQFEFDSTDPKYKIYMIPVKIFQQYTIAIDSDFPVEIICSLFNTKQIDKGTLMLSLHNSTYKKLNSSRFNNPILYSQINTLNYSLIEQLKLEENIDNFKMFIKLPANNSSSIVILEGDYTTNNNFVLTDSSQNSVRGLSKYNTSITNYKKESFSNSIENDDISKIKLITKLQLLKLNSKISHPFADRLIEYLVDNVITNTDSINDNIERLQKSLHQRYNTITIINNIPQHILKGLKSINNLGIWEDKYKNIIYDAAIQENMLIGENFDLLGYVDKDIEHSLISRTIEDEVYKDGGN